MSLFKLGDDITFSGHRAKRHENMMRDANLKMMEQEEKIAELNQKVAYLDK